MSKSTKNTIIKCAILCLTFSATVVTTVNASITRQAGGNRYETSDKILNLWPEGSKVAILAAGSDHDVDALTVAPLAKKMNAPIILVNTSSSIADIVSKFSAYGTVYIANGTGVISEDIKIALEAGGKKVIRLGGQNRYATAYNIAKELGLANTIVVANGDDSHLSDSLSIASIAATKGMPIFLTDGTSLDTTSKDYIAQLGVTKTYVVGGLTLIKDELMSSLPAAERLFGADRYSTNMAIINKFKDDSAIKTDKLYVASGENQNLIDALAVAPLASLTGSPIVFANPKGLTQDAISYLDSIVTNNTDIEIIGGTGAVSDLISNELEEIQTAKTPINITNSIRSIAKVNNINDVVNGTTVGNLKLPVTIDVTLNDGTVDKVNVTWDTSKYITNKVGEQIIVGTLSVSKGKTWILKDAEKAVNIKVTVKAPVVVVTPDNPDIVIPDVVIPDTSDTTAPIITSFPYGTMTSDTIDLVETANKAANGTFTVPTIPPAIMFADTKDTAENIFMMISDINGASIIKNLKAQGAINMLMLTFVPGKVINSQKLYSYNGYKITITDKAGNATTYTMKTK